MARGIFIVGLNGSGKTTLGRALAERLGWFRMDVEDYYFPDTAVPYANARSEDEVRRLMLADIRRHGNFVLSSVHGDLGEEIRSLCALAVWLRAPKALRLARIKQREIARFGDRVLPGGDMYDRQIRFCDFAASRTEASVAPLVTSLGCPLLHIDAAQPIADSVERIVGFSRAHGILTARQAGPISELSR